MRVFLKSIQIQGIKSIQEPLTISFSKKGASSFDELHDYNVKAIYGPNGSGKTALVQTFQILKDILTKKGVLYDPDSERYLLELIHKSAPFIEIHIEFFYLDWEEKPRIFIYEIQLTKTQRSFEITHEKYAQKRQETAPEKTLIETENGGVKVAKMTKKLTTHFTNLLSKRSFLEILNDLSLNSETLETKVHEDFQAVVDFMSPIQSWVNRLWVVMDHHNHPYGLDSTTMIPSYVLEAAADFSIRSVRKDAIIVSEKELELYQQNTLKKERFIQLFKPSIKHLKIESKIIQTSPENTFYTIREWVEYDDYSIDLAYESAGIQKLIRLFDALSHLEAGGVVVMDELDSHINDVYLIKLIEFIALYSNGQLIFTTHNVSPMDTLKSKKNAIDFMALSGTITSWKQVGNYSPSNLYQKGMVQGLPFNIQAESFLTVFPNE